MSKRILFCLFSVIIYSKTHSQFFYKSGTITFHTGDTINCILKIEPTYTKKIFYKTDLQSSEESFDLKDVKHVHTNDQYFSTFKIKNKYILAKLSIPSPDSLFFYIIPYEVMSGYTETSSFKATNFDYVYLLNKTDGVVELNKSKLRKLFSACDLSMKRLNDPRYTIDLVPNIVEEYYRCN